MSSFSNFESIKRFLFEILECIVNVSFQNIITVSVLVIRCSATYREKYKLNKYIVRFDFIANQVNKWYHSFYLLLPLRSCPRSIRHDGQNEEEEEAVILRNSTCSGQWQYDFPSIQIFSKSGCKILKRQSFYNQVTTNSYSSKLCTPFVSHEHRRIGCKL